LQRMAISAIIESGMSFGPYPDGTLFYIEKSNLYSTMRHGVNIAEFLLLRHMRNSQPVVWIIEAKSGSPRPDNPLDFDMFINEVRSKIIHAFSLGLSARLNRHLDVNNDLPGPFRRIDLSITDFRFVLVLNGHKEEWLPPVHDALSKALLSETKIWALSPKTVMVINDVIARQMKLIQ
jgi:hypothetical protein